MNSDAQAALARLAKVQKGEAGADDRFHIEESAPIYEEVDEATYQDLKAKRDNRNFIEGDNGYVDDGEEDWEKDKSEKAKKRRAEREKAKVKKKQLKKNKEANKKAGQGMINFKGGKLDKKFAQTPKSSDPEKGKEIAANIMAALDESSDSSADDPAPSTARETQKPTNPVSSAPATESMDMDDEPTPLKRAPAKIDSSKPEPLGPPAAKRIRVEEPAKNEGEQPKATPGVTPGAEPVAPKVVPEVQFDDMEVDTFAQAPTAPLRQSDGSDFPPHQDGHTNMFWFDAFEDPYNKPGTIYVFGKAVKPETKTLESCCVVVENVQREVYVLPRKGVKLQQVYQEFEEIRKKLNIKKFASGPMTRKYAFRDGAEVAPQAEYLKVMYSYCDPVVPPNFHSGKTYSHMFNTRATALECFLIRRNLVGPSWVSFPSNVSKKRVSWCKQEHLIAARNIRKVEASLNVKPPQFKVMSLEIQGVLNQKKEHEVAVASYVIHQSVDIEGATLNQNELTSYSLVRKIAEDKAYPYDFEKHLVAGSRKTRPSKACASERELLSFLLVKIQQEDPDVITGHSLYDWTLDVLLHRIKKLKVAQWSRIGRLKRNKFPFTRAGKLLKRQLTGRLLCDTFLSAQEFINQAKYSLKYLCNSLINSDPNNKMKLRVSEVDQTLVPKMYDSSKDLVQLVAQIENRAFCTLKLMFHLAIIPLTRELTKLCGNLWMRSLQSARAERNEFLLLHEFYKLGYIIPERYSRQEKLNLGIIKEQGTGKRKAAYAGGLVIEPKRGLYDSIILLLDYNSLYPSIIQEYNLCFTTFKHWEVTLENDDCQLPEVAGEEGVLPRVITRLLDRRKIVKGMLKSETNPTKKKSLDIRQKALKLVANSMYGCLGFPNSRFYCKPIAFMITKLGRQNLQKAADTAEAMPAADGNSNLSVVYGDTDSIMVNTGVKYSGPDSVKKAKAVGNVVKKAVNKTYRKMYLELDDVFARMLLLRKKKYAAMKVEGGKLKREVKGLDQVRRDWSIISKETSSDVLDMLFASTNTEEAVTNVHEYLVELKKKMDANEIDLAKFQITKRLTKKFSEYKVKTQAHLQVAMRMQKQGKQVSTGAFISYIICKQSYNGSIASGRDVSKCAYLMEEVIKSHKDPLVAKDKKLEVDRQWYLENQILPPVQRLCDVIEETSMGQLAHCLGLDAAKYDRSKAGPSLGNLADDDGEEINLSDFQGQFALCDKLEIKCWYCEKLFSLQGVFTDIDTLGLRCPSKQANGQPCPGLISEEHKSRDLKMLKKAIKQASRVYLKRYYTMEQKCSDSMCLNQSFRHLTLQGNRCPIVGCTGTLSPSYTSKQLHSQLRYLNFLFNVKDATEDKCGRVKEDEKKELETKLKASIAGYEDTLNDIAEYALSLMKSCGYEFVRTEDLFDKIWGAGFCC